MPVSEVRTILSESLSAAEKAALQGAVVLDPDTWDAAILGVHTNQHGEVVAVYDENVIVELLLREILDSTEGPHDEEAENDAYDEASEYLQFNTIRALPYMGARAPVLVSELFEDAEEFEVDEEREVIEIGGKRWLVSL
jgi:hypothetical protein